MTLAQLRRLLRDLQRKWRLQDWRLDVNIVERLDGPSPYAHIEHNEFERVGHIKVARTCATEHVPIPSFESSLAHEFAHVLLSELRLCCETLRGYESADIRAVMKDRWELAEERFCNAFAEAVTAKGDRK